MAHAVDDIPPISVSLDWKTAFPEAHVGVGLMDNVDNGPPSAELQRHARHVEDKLHARYAGADGSPDSVRDHVVPWGVHRQGGFRDPFGHAWLVGDRSPLRPA